MRTTPATSAAAQHSCGLCSARCADLPSARLSVAGEDSRNVKVLKQPSLERMALDYYEREPSAWHHSS
jgi:hypothetical protein